MMKSVNELQRLLFENAAFTPPMRIVADVPRAARNTLQLGVPHTIGEELWHVVYWQDRLLRWLDGEELPYPAHASEGWARKNLDEVDWSNLVGQFERGLSAAHQKASDTSLWNRKSALEEPGSGLGRLSAVEVLLNIAVHNAYHLGRIVLIRQLVGCWPPPDGGDTW